MIAFVIEEHVVGFEEVVEEGGETRKFVFFIELAKVEVAFDDG